MRALAAFAAVILIPSFAFAATIYVDGDNTSGPWTGTIDHPYRFIQAAIVAGSQGDRVEVAPGTYFERIDYLGKALYLKADGRYGSTVINGLLGGSVVTFQTGEQLTSVLDGFTITKGTGSDHSRDMLTGGGIYCGPGTAPLIKNNIIIANAAHAGGGIYCIQASPTIKNNSVFENMANNGAGIFCSENCNPLIENNRIRGNTAVYSGGGVSCYWYTQPRIVKNAILANRVLDSTGAAGGIYCYFSDPEIVGNEICGNLCSGEYSEGGGIHCHSSSPLAVHNTLYLNEAKYGGGLFVEGDLSSPRVYNSILWNNKAQSAWGPQIYQAAGSLLVSHSDVEGGWSGSGNINADPLFVEPAVYDLHLFFTSPCRNQGDGAAPSLPATDRDGNPLPSYGMVDMGADEIYIHFYVTGHAVPGGVLKCKFIGQPGTADAGLFFSKGILQPPIPSAYGPWYLMLPAVFLGNFGPLSVDGFAQYTPTLPPHPTDSFYLQAFIKNKLTALCEVQVLQ